MEIYTYKPNTQVKLEKYGEPKKNRKKHEGNQQEIPLQKSMNAAFK